MCPALGEDVMAWHRMTQGEKKDAATIFVEGKTYTADEIDRMHYGPKS